MLGKPERRSSSRWLAEAGRQLDDKADRPPRLGDDMATFENMRHIIGAYSEYDQEYAYHKPKTE